MGHNPLMKRIISILFLGVIALSCINPQSAAKDKAKTVRVMADQIATKFKKAPQVTIEDYLVWKEANQELVLVDVRPIKERKVSTLPGAISKEEFETNKDKFKNHKVIAYCTIGYRSSEYVQKLISKNFKAYNLKESLLGWAHRGHKFQSNGKKTNRAHIYEDAWNFLPVGYEGVSD